MKALKEWIPYIIIVIVVILIRSFIATPVRVIGDSMNTTLAHGQILLLKKFDKTYERYDIVVINIGNERIIKRIIGLPGESVIIVNNTIYINGEAIEDKYASTPTADFNMTTINSGVIPEDKYFVLGDNREVSKDSRILGLIPKSKILGIADFRIWPLTKIGGVDE